MSDSEITVAERRSQRSPFIFELLNREGRDLLFLRISGKPKPGQWALHMDLDHPFPEKVLIFAKTDIPAREIVHEVQRALVVWREQTEPLFGEEEPE